MFCVYGQPDGLHIYRDHAPPDINVVELHPATARYVTNLPSDADWYAVSTNVLPKQSSDVTEVLKHFRNASAVPSELGGLRKLDNADRSCCNLLLNSSSAFESNPSPEVLQSAIESVKVHPAWRSGLGFMTGDVISNNLVYVLADVFDIRRFMRGSAKRALRMYFRLATAAAAERVLMTNLSVEDSKKPPYVRLSALISSWLDTVRIFPRAIINQMPHAFLIRLMDKCTQEFMASNVPKSRATMLGIYRSTIKALDFIRLMWLHGLGIKQFDPFKFFSEEVEAFAFVDYTLRI